MMTKEEMIQEIRKVVIMANNPKCKTYDEALAEEIKDDNHYLNDCKVVMQNGDIKIIPYYLLLKNTNLIQYGKYEFLGLPLTLERVLVALNHNIKKIYYVSCGEEIRIYNNFISICKWSKAHNQSKETIRVIYKQLFSSSR